MSHRLSEIPSLHLGAYALCVDGAGRLLLSRMRAGYPDAGQWTLPGGGLEWGEDPASGALRELEEETGLRADSVDAVVAVYSHVYPRGNDGSGVHHVGLLYRVFRFIGEVRPEVDGSTDLCDWFEEEDASRLPLTPLGKFGVRHAWGSGS